MRVSRTSLVLATTCLLASLSAAQSIYLDAGGPSSTPPSSSYAAASGTPGYWNSMSNPATLALLDIQGQATSAIATGLTCDWGLENFPTTSGDDEALLDDWHYADCHEGQLQLHIDGLRAGTYELYLYPLASGLGLNNFDLTLSPGATADGGLTGTTNVPGAFAGSFATWHVTVRVLHLQADGSFVHLHGGGIGLAGLQLVRLGDAISFCGGDQGRCPCGIGQVGSGCPSSISPAGASLVGAGSMQVTSDSFQLSASSVSNSIVTFFQGTDAQNLGQGTPFGDGLRCVGGSVVRLASVQALGGVAQYPQPGDPSISVRGAVPATGGFRAYQVWYRNAADYCTPSTFNLTNGVAVQWLP